MGFKVRVKLARPERPVKTHSTLNTGLSVISQKPILGFTPMEQVKLMSHYEIVGIKEGLSK